jgi:hypothetical protein
MKDNTGATHQRVVVVADVAGNFIKYIKRAGFMTCSLLFIV